MITSPCVRGRCPTKTRHAQAQTNLAQEGLQFGLWAHYFVVCDVSVGVNTLPCCCAQAAAFLKRLVRSICDAPRQRHPTPRRNTTMYTRTERVQASSVHRTAFAVTICWPRGVGGYLVIEIG